MLYKILARSRLKLIVTTNIGNVAKMGPCIGLCCVLGMMPFNTAFADSEGNIKNEYIPERRLIEIVALTTFYASEGMWERFPDLVPDIDFYMSEDIRVPVNLLFYALNVEDESAFRSAFNQLDMAVAFEYFTERDETDWLAKLFDATIIGLERFGIEHSDKDALRASAIEHANARRFDVARILYHQLITVDPGDGRAAMGLGHIYRFRGDIERAERFYQTGWENGYSDAMTFHLALLVDYDRYEDAAELAGGVDAENVRDDLLLQYLLLNLAVRMNDHELFLQAYENAAVVDLMRDSRFDDSEGVIRRGLAEFSNEDALREFEKLVEDRGGTQE